MRISVYMRLMGGADDGVYRPVQAERLGDGRYRIVGPVPESETWEFQPGEIVGTGRMEFNVVPNPSAPHGKQARVVAVALFHSN